jgi:hypothetical protein
VPEGVTATIQVRVTTPTGIAPSDSFTLSAVSLNIPGVTVTVTGTTTTYTPEVVMQPVYLPFLRK